MSDSTLSNEEIKLRIQVLLKRKEILNAERRNIETYIMELREKHCKHTEFDVEEAPDVLLCEQWVVCRTCNYYFMDPRDGYDKKHSKPV